MSSFSWPPTGNTGGANTDVNVFDALGNPISSTGGALDVSAQFAPNSNGSTVNTTLSGTTASSFVPPANAVGFILEAESGNSDNVRWRLGGTASASAGTLAEPGRDTGYVPTATTISVCAVASTVSNKVNITWILSS